MFFELVLFDIISFCQVYLVLNLSLSCCGFQTTTTFVFTQPKFRYWENCAACPVIIKYWSGFFYNLSKPWKKNGQVNFKWTCRNFYAKFNAASFFFKELFLKSIRSLPFSYVLFTFSLFWVSLLTQCEHLLNISFVFKSFNKFSFRLLNRNISFKKKIKIYPVDVKEE